MPVQEPTYSHSVSALFALTASRHRIAKIDPSDGSTHTMVSKRLVDIGENVVPSPTENHRVFVPQPKLDRVAALSSKDLQPIGALPVGHAPSYLSVDSGSKALLAISERGKTVTGVDLRDGELLAPQPVNATPQAEVEGPKRGRLLDYHVTGPTGIAHYKGPQGGVHKKGELSIDAAKVAGDKIKASRLYVAAKGTGELVAVDTHRSHKGMHVIARSKLGAPIKHLAADEVRIFAATDKELIVLETNSYEGFDNNQFNVMERIDYRNALPRERLKQTSLSGMAVGSERVYMTLQGEPYVVSVGKPDM